MNKNYFFLVLLLCNTILFAQNNDFNNNGGDLLWSNPANWSENAIPTSADKVRLPLLLESLVNQDFTVLKIQTTSATGASSTAEIKKAVVAGTNTLTVDAVTANGIGIQNNSSNDVDFSFKGKVIINNSSAGFTKMNNANGADNSITFEEDSELTLQTGLDSANGSGGDNFNFNGTITGSANLRLTGTTINTFGSTSSNPNYTGQIVFIGSSQLIVNTADNNTFYNGEKIQVNANNASVVLNGENVFGAGIAVGGVNTFSFSANKNQNSMKTVTFTGAGTLNMTIDNSVTNLSFENSSEATWEAGSTLNITNYQEGVLRFGTDNTGLTSDQLTKIVVDGVSDSVGLNSDGYLVNQTSLSINDFNENAITPIAYPTLASNNIYFKKLQNNVKIFDLNGKMLLHSTSINQSKVTIDKLSSGLYFIVFDNKKVEKFLKK